MLASITEEVKYRLYLTKFNFNYLTFSLSLFFADLIMILVWPNNFNLFEKDYLHILSYYFTLLMFSLIIYFFLKNLIQKEQYLKIYIEKRFIIFFFLQALLFACWHIFFSNQLNNHHFITVFIIQFIGGIYFGFVRMNYGIKHSILLHFLINFLPIIF